MEVMRHSDMRLTNRTYTDARSGKEICYGVKGIKKGLGAGLLAGATSGMLGIGGGVIKVPVMNTCMCVPMKAATATISRLIGFMSVHPSRFTWAGC